MAAEKGCRFWHKKEVILMNKAVYLFIIIMIIPISIFAIDISDDGRKIAQASNSPGHILAITDVVPLPPVPDYVCNLRMQVGGLDLGDLDNDSDLDLAVGCYHSESYPPYDDWRNFLLVNNDGTLETSPTWWSADERSTTDVKWADFDGDGYLDLFATNGDFTFDPSVIYFGSADGLSNTPGWVVNNNCWTLCAAPLDIDHDGDIDVAIANQGANQDPYRHIYIYYNTGNGLPLVPSWQSADLMITSYLDWGDMNNDSWYELAASKGVDFESGVYRNNQGIITFYPVWTSGSNRADDGIGWGDVDGDSYPELAVGGAEPTWLFDNVDGQLGDAPIWQSDDSYNGCQDLKWGDIDNDGDLDLATVHFSDGQLRIYLNIDGVLESTPSWIYQASGAGTALEFGDINGDGWLDLVMGQSGQPSVMVFLNTRQTHVDSESERPHRFALKQNYPNPFNVSTRIEFELAESGHATLAVYDLLGRRIAILVDDDISAGQHFATWNAEGESSGMYFYRLIMSDKIETRRMMLVK